MQSSRTSRPNRPNRILHNSNESLSDPPAPQARQFFPAIEDFFKSIAVRLIRVFVRPRKTDTAFDASNVRSILVVRQHDQLGDMLCAVPLLRALRQKFPSASITLVASPVNYSVMLHHPYVDEVIAYDKARFLVSVRALWESIRKKQFDLAVVPGTVSISFTSNLIALLSGARWRIGPESLNGIPNASSYCFSTTVVLNWTEEKRRHQSLRNLDILRPLGISTNDLSSIIGLTTEEKKEARRLLAPLRKQFRFLVGLHPGAGKTANRWRADGFSTVANRLSKELGAGIVITSGPKDEEHVQQVLRHLEGTYLLIARQPIRAVAAVIDGLDLYITNDTGTMHVAGGTAAGILAIFGPTDPLEWAPVGQKNHYITAKDGRVASITDEEVFSMASVILRGLRQS